MADYLIYWILAAVVIFLFFYYVIMRLMRDVLKRPKHIQPPPPPPPSSPIVHTPVIACAGDFCSGLKAACARGAYHGQQYCGQCNTDRYERILCQQPGDYACSTLMKKKCSQPPSPQT